jgi:hypothetical protein
LGLWYIVEWEVYWDKGEECDKVVRNLMKRWKQLAPDKQFRYFRQRFRGSGKEVLVITGLNNASEIDPFLAEVYKDEEFMQLTRKWHSCIGNSNKPSYWEEKFTVE